MATKYLDYNGLLYFWQKIKNLFAPLASPTFTGTPTAPTATTGTSTTQVATTEFVANTVGAMTSGVSDVKVDSVSVVTSGVANINTMTGATTSANGTKGLVPAPSSNANVGMMALGADGTWKALSLGTPSSISGGLQLDLDFGSSEASTTIPAATPNGSAWGVVKVEEDVEAHQEGTSLWQMAYTKITTRSGSTNAYFKMPTDPANTYFDGLMSSTDKTKLNAITITNGIIDSSCLPSFVDDVIEAYPRSNQTELGSTWLATGSASGTVITPETGKIYVLMADSTSYSANSQFRWGGTAYVKLADGGVSSITNGEIDTIVAS